MRISHYICVLMFLLLFLEYIYKQLYCISFENQLNWRISKFKVVGQVLKNIHRGYMYDARTHSTVKVTDADV